ncbi:MAG TPA: tetratricopeptide repeat protein, partial [Acidimicrobiia bacterium]|nr:tetratricopeptide repeat protein [Acidimicrobiia bacterium]
DEARADAGEALAIAEGIGHRGWTATAWRALGIVAQTEGDLDRAEEAFGHSLDRSSDLPLFASWAAARLALIQVARGDAGAAEAMTLRALSVGPSLGHYEARWARAELAAARGEPDGPAIIRDALARAEAGGHQVSVRRLRQLVGSAG